MLNTVYSSMLWGNLATDGWLHHGSVTFGYAPLTTLIKQYVKKIA